MSQFPKQHHDHRTVAPIQIQAKSLPRRRRRLLLSILLPLGPRRRRQRRIDTQIPAPDLCQVLEQETPLEVRVGMQNGVEVGRAPQVGVLDALQLGAVLVLKDAVAGNVVALLADVFLDGAQKIAIDGWC